MKNHEGCTRGFSHLSAAWYGAACLDHTTYVDQVMIGFYHPDGGTTGEFAVRWYPLGVGVSPCLEAFNDAWSALYEFRDVMAKLAEHDSEDMTPAALCALLVERGVEDMTAREYA